MEKAQTIVIKNGNNRMMIVQVHSIMQHCPQALFLDFGHAGSLNPCNSLSTGEIGSLIHDHC